MGVDGMPNNHKSTTPRILLDCGDLQSGRYRIDVVRVGSKDHQDMEQITLHIYVSEDGELQLSPDGEFGAFSSAFSGAFRKREHYTQYTRSIESVPQDAKVLDVRKMIDRGV